ncbi:hypothetical protein AX767_03065 [Variovorax sp. PAMC 28711]|nr:hypothetical protein AX767_03065 [Variovorax sp. PAMC 28711]
MFSVMRPSSWPVSTGGPSGRFSSMSKAMPFGFSRRVSIGSASDSNCDSRRRLAISSLRHNAWFSGVDRSGIVRVRLQARHSPGARLVGDWRSSAVPPGTSQLHADGVSRLLQR